MSRLPPVAAYALLAACASGSAAGGPSTPAPEAGKTPYSDSPSGRGPTVAYRPVRSATFKLERHDSLLLQYPGGASQQQIKDRTAHLRLALAESPTPGSYQVTIVLDSLLAWENGAPVTPDSGPPAPGTTWSATLTLNGQLSPLNADRSSTLGDELAGGLRLLFPALPPDGVREGMEWTDSTQYRLVADAFPGTEASVTTYRAIEGGSSITLESSGSYRRSGTRIQAEQELQMTASGSRRGTHVLGLDGVLVSAQGNDSGEMTITVPALGQTVPVKQSGSYTITATSKPSR
ncbi:MAG: hypothetical protein ACREMX_14535 [Gemmatimonadales bacterium]